MSNAPVTTRPSSRPIEDTTSGFLDLRPRLLGIAHRILGSWAEAEDVVQDAWIRWQTYDRTTVLSPTAFLVTTTTRLAINASLSARARRESPVGQWLPEPVDASDDLALGAERGEAVEFAILLLLERLSPMERATYVLRQAFDYPYPRIADTLRISEANARQHVCRAGRLAEERRQAASPVQQRRLVDAFVAAARRGDVAPMEELFVADVTDRDPALSLP